MQRAVRKPSSLVIAAAACVAVAGVSLALPSAPTYDPYMWLIWGREIAHLHLVTTDSGTSWKPLPALLAALLSPLGKGQAGSWLVVARAGGLFAAFMAFRLAWRITGPRWGPLAGLAAAATFVLAHDVVRRTAVGNSEALTAACMLLAVDRHLDRHRGQAFALLVAAGLMRPEAWLFLLVYGAWLWVAPERPPRLLMAGLALLIPLLWLGGDWVGSGHLWTASDRALNPIKNSPGVAAHPAVAVLQEAWRMLPVPARVAAPFGLAAALVAFARARRERLILLLAGSALVWTGMVAVMAQRGYPGLPRFLFPATGAAAVVAGVGVVRIAQLVSSPVGVLPRGGVWWRAARGTVIAVAGAAAILAFAALAVPDATRLPADAAAIDTVVQRDDGLSDAVQGVGGPAAVLRCGHPYTGWFEVTALAWDLGVPAGLVHDSPHGRHPVVFALGPHGSGLQTPLPRRHVQVADRVDGWSVVDRCPNLA
jgi:hypothetical protein